MFCAGLGLWANSETKNRRPRKAWFCAWRLDIFEAAKPPWERRRPACNGGRRPPTRPKAAPAQAGRLRSQGPRQTHASYRIRAFHARNVCVDRRRIGNPSAGRKTGKSGRIVMEAWPTG